MKSYNPCLLFLFFLTLVFFPLHSIAQTAPTFAWAKNCYTYFDGTNTYANYGTAICTDDHANNYTTGSFGGTIYFDTCTLSGTSTGLQNYYFVSYDSSGNFRWAKQFSGHCTSLNHDVVYDYAGHIYTTGEFEDSIAFDGNNYYSIGQAKGNYIARFDTSGDFQWAKIFEPKVNAIGWVPTIRLNADNLHNIYAIGGYEDTLKIDGNIINIPATDNFYFAKFDSSGTLQFIKSGFATNVGNLQITHDIQSHIYITSMVTNTVNIQSISMTGKGMFIAGFNATGNFKWMIMAFGNAVTPNKIQVVDNLLYLAGFYNDSLQIGNTTFYTPTLNHNTFLAQFDTMATFYWAKRIDIIQGNQIRINSMIATDNYIYVAGEFTKSLSFNGNSYSATTPINSARDPFVAAYDNYGNELWFKSAGSFHEDYGFDIDIDQAQNIYLTGSTHFPSYFDNIMLTDSIGGIGGNNQEDTYITKLGNSNVLSTPSVSTSPQVMIYPNPLTTQCTISFSNPRNYKFIFTLTDITGHIIENFKTKYAEINLSKGNKATGVYLFNLFNEQTGKSMNGKIVVSE